jgi:hypothetical protein
MSEIGSIVALISCGKLVIIGEKILEEFLNNR